MSHAGACSLRRAPVPRRRAGGGTDQFVNRALIADPQFLVGMPSSFLTAGIVFCRGRGGMGMLVMDPRNRSADLMQCGDLCNGGIIIGGGVTARTMFLDPPGQQRGDTFGLGWFLAGASDEFGPVPTALFGPRNGMGVEWFSTIQAMPWLNITPDVQWLRAGLGAIATDSAFVYGVRANATF